MAKHLIIKRLITINYLQGATLYIRFKYAIQLKKVIMRGFNCLSPWKHARAFVMKHLFGY